jgi:hypothetical protein
MVSRQQIRKLRLSDLSLSSRFVSSGGSFCVAKVSYLLYKGTRINTLSRLTQGFRREFTSRKFL